jgi:hypothetical protein
MIDCMVQNLYTFAFKQQTRIQNGRSAARLKQVRYSEKLRLLLLASVCIAFQTAQAERHIRVPTSEGKTSSVSLHVRALRASDPKGNANNSDEKDNQIKLSSTLIPFQRKLATLPFRSFELMSEEEAVVSLKKKHHIQLINGHHLVVRPLFLREDGNICLWLRWQDKEGMKLLDSRIHVPLGETVLAGVEQSPTSGMVLTIDVAIEPPPT